MINTITVDLGNSNPHFCTFINNKSQNVLPLSQFNKEIVTSNTNIIVSNVTSELPEELIGLNIIEPPTVSLQKFLNMHVNYTASLGQDRIIQSYYLHENQDSEEVILIDAGTFITIDKISKEKGFEGGFIFPGINTFLSSYKSGARLPQVDSSQVYWEGAINFTPNNTYEAISEAVKLYLSSILATYKDKNVVLTGGSSDLIINYLGPSKTQVKPNLIHESLNFLCQQLIN